MISSIKRFFLAKRNFFLISLSVFLLFCVLIIDIAFYSRSVIPPNIYWTREGMVILATIFIALAVSRRHLAQNQNIIYKLKTSFFSIIGLYLAALVPNIILNENTFQFAKEYVQFVAVLQNSLRNAIIAVFVTTFLFANIYLVRDFVLYRSRKGTHRLFHIGLLTTLILIVYGHFSRKVYTEEWSFLGRNSTEWILISFLLLIMVLLSIRTAWVNYLNKRQKILSFWSGMLLLPGIGLFLQSDTLGKIQQFSFTLGTIDSVMTYFLFIYMVTSVLSLLFHLPTASIFDKKMQEIASLQSMSRIVSSVLQYDEVVNRVTELAQQVLRADSCWLEMVDQNGELVIVSSQNLSEFEKKRMLLKKNEGLSGWIIENKHSVLINEVHKDTRAAYLRNFRKNLGSIVGVPLISQNGVIGVLYAIKDEIFGFDQEDREMLQAFANQATVAIENARLVESSLEKQRLEQELKLARETQLKLLPKRTPELPGIQLDAYCITANEVGGDYYDFVPLNPTKLGLVIADVSGKGISAAFYMAELKGIVNSFARQYQKARDFMINVNHTLYENVDRRTFVSMIYAVLDAQKKRLSFCRAGHCPLLYYQARKDQLIYLKPKGIGLALDSGEIFDRNIEEQEVRCAPGDFFIFFTDGLTEARNEKKEEYGEERLYQLVHTLRKETISEIQQGIIADVEKFVGGATRHDDLSIIGLRITE